MTFTPTINSMQSLSSASIQLEHTKQDGGLGPLPTHRQCTLRFLFMQEDVTCRSGIRGLWQKKCVLYSLIIFPHDALNNEMCFNSIKLLQAVPGIILSAFNMETVMGIEAADKRQHHWTSYM